ncbi:MAG TPA: class I SAM-dependent methyltransferase [Dactylosporangium sp.]|nr:class I SAM-dependent methyltransferase [Dactylosporangium sp.]
MARFVLFPGRHHLLTRFQAVYLRGLAEGDVSKDLQGPRFGTAGAGADDVTIIWAVTSANHQNTKRNPIAYDRREAAIERFSVQEGLRSLVVPVFDTAHTDRFAEVTLKSVESVIGRRLTPQDTVVACSTPEVAALYAALGFAIALVEADPAFSTAADRPHGDSRLRTAAPAPPDATPAPPNVTPAVLSVAPAPLDVASAPLDVTSAPLNVTSTPLDVTSAPLNVASAHFDVTSGVAPAQPESEAVSRPQSASAADSQPPPEPSARQSPAPERPWDVLLRLAAGDPAWRELAHPATLDVYDRYRLDEQVALVVNDPVVGEEGGLTATRDYRTYAEAFEASAERKWEMVRQHVRPGRIVDVGCGAGAVLALADREPTLRESDLIGVEVARHLYEECVHRKAQGWFTNPNVYFYCRNVLGGAVFPPRSIDTTLTFALTHEIWSYGHRMPSLRAFAEAIYEHTVPGGVWINSDVCGPDGRDRRVRLTLQGTPPSTTAPSASGSDTAGPLATANVSASASSLGTADVSSSASSLGTANVSGSVSSVGTADVSGSTSPSDVAGPAAAVASLDGLTRDEIAALVESLPTRARLDRFAADFHFPLVYKDLGDPSDPGAVEIALGDAMEFLTHKDYPDNWLSEAHEQFCGLEFADWKALLTDVGFEVDVASHAWRNDWIVDNRIRPHAQLSTLDGIALDWPDTHVLLIARRPLNT